MKFAFKPKKKISQNFTVWYAWHPVRVSDNQLAWFEPVYRREVTVYRRDRKTYKTKYMSKEDYFTQSMKKPESICFDDGDKCDEKESAGMTIQASNQIR
jgi:hypothetical protein